jgi:glycosyltransferase involved in cell wall biosynthesis
MRLAIEITTCREARTGIGYYTEHLVDALLATMASGDDLVLLSNQTPAAGLAERWAPYIHVEGPGVRAVWMQIGAPALLDKTGADVALFPNYAVPLASPCPTIVIVHDLAVLCMPQHATLQKRLLMQPMLRQVVKTASVIGTVSRASQAEIVQRLGVAEARTAVFPGAAHPSCRPAPADAVASARSRYGLTSRYVLTVGTLEPRKDLQTLLRAFDRLRQSGEAHELVVVGGRGWKDRALVRELEARAGNGVRWLGYVKEGDLAALYTGADLFAFSPVLEGFGLPLVEAMACGTAVVASDVPALREVGGDVARYVPPGDDALFARAIGEELGDPSRLAARGAAGLSRARNFSWTKTAEAVWQRARETAPVRHRRSPMSPRPASALPVPVSDPPPTMSVEEWSLLSAVLYADLFDSPLPLEDAARAGMGTVLREDAIRKLVESARLEARLTVFGDAFVVLAGREHLAARMPERAAMTRALLHRHQRALALIAALPFVRALVISGGVAHRNVTAKADIDLFVIAARGRAYTAYTLLFLATSLTGTRKVICPNYVIDEGELPIAYHRDLFTAHQLVSARPLSGHAAYEALCRANEEWVRAFFPGFDVRPKTDEASRSWLSSLAEAAFFPFGPVTEVVTRALWRSRLRRRAAKASHADVVLTPGILKLHLSDYRARVLARFAATLDALRTEETLPVPAAPHGSVAPRA